MTDDVAVLIEHLEGAVAEVSYEMLAKGRELAKASGGRLVAVLLGHGVRGLVSDLGAADAVALVEQGEGSLGDQEGEAEYRGVAEAGQIVRVAPHGSSSRTQAGPA